MQLAEALLYVLYMLHPTVRSRLRPGLGLCLCIVQEEIEYSLFSINIDPDALGTLYERVEGFLRNPRKLLALQRNLEKVQVLYGTVHL